MLSFNEKFDILLAKIDERFDRLEAKMDAMIAKLDGSIVNVNRRYVETDASLVKKETVLKEANIEVNRIELSLFEMRSYSGTQATTDYICEEVIDGDISRHEVIEEQSELDIVNDIEVDWDEDIVFDHSTIESKPIVTEQQLTEVRCLYFHPKCSLELVSAIQQEEKIMKHMATDVEVSTANVLKVETELNSCIKFEVGLPRKVWDPGLDNILL